MVTTTFFELSREIRAHISQGDIKTAFETLNSHTSIDHKIDELILRSAQFHILEKDSRKGIITEEYKRIELNRIANSLLEFCDVLEKVQKHKTRIFLSYSHKEPDNSIATSIYAYIKNNHFDVFIANQDMVAGQDWAKRIMREIELSDYFIVFLSENSNKSEMVLAEVEHAKQMQDFHSLRKPVIIPIRIQKNHDFHISNELNSYLKKIHYIEFDDDTKIEVLGNQLINIFKDSSTLSEIGDNITEKQVQEFLPKGYTDNSPMPSAPLEKVGGAMMSDSPFYIQREGEADFINLIQQPAAILRIKGPRQHGKTSLLSKTLNYAAKELRYNTAHLSFQLLDRSSFLNFDKLCLQFCVRICRETNLLNSLKHELKEFWADDLFTVKEKCSTFFEEYILNKLDKPLIIGLDEVDALFRYEEVSDDFFSMIRAWHDSAAIDEKNKWDQIRFVLSYSTEIHLAIKNIDQSPFNVGHERIMYPFNENEITQLIDIHPVDNKDNLNENIFKFTGGFPYLSRKALYLLSTSSIDIGSLVNNAANDNGPFNDHLRHMHLLLQRDPESSAVMKELIKNERTNNKDAVNRLRAAGLIKGNFPDVDVSNDLYKNYFNRIL